MATTIVVRTDVSGTSFVLDVTALELSSSLSTLDFEVTHNGVINANYTKTSQTQLTYTGTNVTIGTKVIARRVSSVVQSETTFISTTTASALTNGLEKLRLRIEELDARLSYTLAQITLGGITIGSIPVSNTIYGAGWDNDTTNAPSKNAVYDKIELLNPAFNTATAASINVTGNGVLASVLNVTTALGSLIYRYAIVKSSYNYNGNAKSAASITSVLRDNALTAIDARAGSIFNTSSLENGNLTQVKLMSGSFTGSYNFNLAVSIGATVPTDVYALTSVNIDVIFIP